MFSIGIRDFHFVLYPRLPTGSYQFQVIGLDLLGNPDGTTSSLSIYVPPPFWRRLWFWATMLVVSTALIVGGARYVVWQRLRREMARLKTQQVLTSERLRIAHDIHDDLGARITQITMVSAMSLNDPALSVKTRADLEQIKQLSRNLVSALYETVWAVNPANDNLDALGSYLCEMASQLCDRTPCHCRLHVSELPQDLPVSSQVRHNVTLVVKEAINNAIKHAQSSEITITIQLNDQVLDIEIKDNGSGFQPVTADAGYGLANMRQRMNDIGGSCSITSQPGSGAAVRLQWVVRSKIKSMAIDIAYEKNRHGG
jgi:signal transduction histidine kinase